MMDGYVGKEIKDYMYLILHMDLSDIAHHETMHFQV